MHKTFREEKTILGCGQAQVRNPQSSENAPAFIALLYSMIHLANHRIEKSETKCELPRPKWYEKEDSKRTTTGDLINNMRAQLWAKALNINFLSFVNKEKESRSLRNTEDPVTSSMLYMRN